MRVKTLGIFIATVLLIFAGMALWRNLTVPAEVLSYDEVTASSREGNGGPITVRTRRVRQGDVVSEQVELGPETWVDCFGDCAETLRKQDLDFWETRRRWEH